MTGPFFSKPGAWLLAVAWLGADGALAQEARSRCGADVLPAQATMTIHYNGQSETIPLTSAGLPDAVIVGRRGLALEPLPLELVSLSLHGQSALVGSVVLRAGRQYGLPASKGQMQGPAQGGTYLSFFDVFAEVDFPDLRFFFRGNAAFRQEIRREPAAIVVAPLTANVAPVADTRCDAANNCTIPAPGWTCAEIVINGADVGCAARNQ